MAALAEQIPTLAGVLVGAVLSYAFTSLAERNRWRRALSVRWDERRLQAYIEYANAIKASVNVVVLILAGKGITRANRALSEPEGLAMLSEVEGDRSLKYDAVLMLGDTDTIAAAKDLTQHMWQMHAFARGQIPVDERIWQEAFSDYRRTRTRFYHTARSSMGVAVADIHAQSTWLEYTQELQNNTAQPPDS
jgi:hypothetical protein